MTEAEIRARHRFAGADVASGRIQEGVLRCSCGERWYDPDAECPALECELDALQSEHARMDDDGAPARI